MKDRVGRAATFLPLTSNENGAPPTTRDSARTSQNHHFLCRLPSKPITTRQKPLRSLRRADARAGILRKSIKKLGRRIQAWHEDLAKAEKYKAYARYGELIKANLGTIRKGQTDVTLVDYFDEELPNLTIPLDQTKTPQGNMDDYFRKHRKHLAAERELHPRIKKGRRSWRLSRQELTAIEQETWQPPNKPHLIVHARTLPRAGGRKGP